MTSTRASRLFSSVRSNLLLNPDGTIRSLAGYTQVTDLRNIGREGIDQRTLRLGIRLGF